MIIFCSKSNFSDPGAAYHAVNSGVQAASSLVPSAAYQRG
ncbi:hypothetical protein HMPREF1617_01821 [Escherichia coli 908675]|nr:hypothetical protein HMPREF1617_01821 [Escherichia coli 908675]